MSSPAAPVPPIEAWLAAIVRHSNRLNVKVTDVLSGGRDKPVRLARWEAWREIFDTYPDASVAGVAKLTGFDHTTILRAMNVLPKARREHELEMRAKALAEAKAEAAKPMRNARPETREEAMRRMWKASVPYQFAPGAYNREEAA